MHEGGAMFHFRRQMNQTHSRCRQVDILSPAFSASVNFRLPQQDYFGSHATFG